MHIERISMCVIYYKCTVTIKERTLGRIKFQHLIIKFYALEQSWL